MPDRHQIRCVKKSDRYNPHERITHIGGVNTDGSRWKITQTEAVDGIDNNEWAIVDLDDIGEEEILTLIRQNKHIDPIIHSVKSVDIGEWDDDHPLNITGNKAAWEKIFPALKEFSK